MTPVKLLFVITTEENTLHIEQTSQYKQLVITFCSFEFDIVIQNYTVLSNKSRYRTWTFMWLINHYNLLKLLCFSKVVKKTVYWNGQCNKANVSKLGCYSQPQNLQADKDFFLRKNSGGKILTKVWFQMQVYRITY